jgi:hypothetical protein
MEIAQVMISRDLTLPDAMFWGRLKRELEHRALHEDWPEPYYARLMEARKTEDKEVVVAIFSIHDGLGDVDDNS